jgi:hypothetical protein
MGTVQHCWTVTVSKVKLPVEPRDATTSFSGGLAVTKSANAAALSRRDHFYLFALSPGARSVSSSLDMYAA